jgi:hypothetical protein
VPIRIANPFTLRPGGKGHPELTFGSLPLRVQAVIVTMTASAVLGGAWNAPHARFDPPLGFFGLLAASVMLAASQVRLPLLPTAATLSLSYCANFASLAPLGPFESALVVAAGAWSQCVLNSSGRTPVHRTVFSVANVVTSSQAAALAAVVAGGTRRGTGWRWSGRRWPPPRRSSAVTAS